MTADVLLLAIGNPLRGDEGVARAVAERVARDTPVVTQCTPRLAPEHATELARYDAVVFVDADPAGDHVHVEELSAVPRGRTAAGQAMGPHEVVALARLVCAFEGRAWLCRVPAREFAEGEGLSEFAEAAVAIAARHVESLASRFGAGLVLAPRED